MLLLKTLLLGLTALVALVVVTPIFAQGTALADLDNAHHRPVNLSLKYF